MQAAPIQATRRPAWVLALAAGCALLPCSALAQHADENAATQSDDAFGRSIGTERSGLYTGSEVRGFNPSEAGNVRLNGLYFDLVNLVSARLIEGLAVRVGIAAQRYPFPAPTGLVDYDLAIPRGEAELSVVASTASSYVLGPGILADFKLPLDGERFGIAGGAAIREATREEGAGHHFRTISGLAAFRPFEGAEFLAFSSKLWTLDWEARPTYFPAANQLPAKVPRVEWLGFDWTEYDFINETHGGMARVPLGKGLRLEAGLFYSRRTLKRSFADFLLGVTPQGGLSDRLVVAAADNIDESLSGEVRLVREWTADRFEHRLIASVRGRSRNRLFGGSRQLLLGPGPGNIFTAEGWSQPTYTTDPKNKDRVRQLVPGVAYSLLWQGRASLDISVAKNGYRKAIDFADEALDDPVTRDRSWLWNVSASVALMRNFYLFGGMSRGQEDAIVAPDNAVNNAEAPPAVRTRQVELGLRLGITPRLTLVAGVFSISKPYYNLDAARFYRELGTVRNRGVELSLTGQLAPGLNLVGGVLLLDPSISGEAVNTGLIGKRPVGQSKLRVVGNLDWRLNGGEGAWSFDIALQSHSASTGNAANTLSAPAYSLVNLGARYRFEVGDVKIVIRPQLTNLFNAYGWKVSSIGGFTYSRPRRAVVSLIADF
ncbi:MAG: TonB-dependent receptor [Novosphingobium sp.]|nr:TonB-dependent receptor [Novosphingobium sp.]